jgi:translation initiation factor 1
VSPEKGRVVYTSDKGRVCPKCGWPAADCHCFSALGAPDEAVPEKLSARLRLENRGAGKNVTVVDGLPKNGPFLEALARELKKSCGTGGHPGQSCVELQGDQRERLRELLSKKGFAVKG